MVVRSIQGLSSDSSRMKKTEEKHKTVVPHQKAPGSPEEDDGRIIIMTLHQPSSEIWEMLDHLVLLVQGHIIYNGPSHLALDFFVSCGYARPLHVNPSDYFLDIVQCQEDEDAQAVSRVVLVCDVQIYIIIYIPIYTCECIIISLNFISSSYFVPPTSYFVPHSHLKFVIAVVR